MGQAERTNLTINFKYTKVNGRLVNQTTYKPCSFESKKTSNMDSGTKGLIGHVNGLYNL